VKVVDAIAEIMKREGVEFLSTYPTTPIIDAAAAVGIRPVLCRQERVGVGIADGFSRTTNGRRLGVFAMQYGPGAENAFSGVATAFSDSVPMLVLPLGHQRDRAQVFPLFSSAKTYASVTKWVETLKYAANKSGTSRHAGHGGDLAIGRDPAQRNAANYSADRFDSCIALKLDNLELALR